tara:strand:- start:25 stop:474 length:450 start_codon:yes stop_codon:yes gene_type:complete
VKTENIFQEAIGHCRWKKNLYPVLEKINISNYKNKSFNDIFIEIYNMTENVTGVGLLSTYDIVAAICRYHNIKIDKVFIIGGGPKRAIKLLGVSLSKYIMPNGVKLNYAEIVDIKNAFKKNKYKLDKHMKYSRDGDEFESYLCNWQKSI